MTKKKDLTDDNMTGMPKPNFDINHNPFRDGDSLVDAVRAVLSGQPVTQEQAKELEKQNPADALKKEEVKKEDASNDKSDDGEGLDKADPKAAKKKFADRKDKDIDNDGDTDDSDEYLHKKRKAITKDVEKDDAQEGNAFSKALENAKKNGDKTFVVAGKKYNCEDVQEGERIGGPSKKDYEKKHDAKIIATKMKRNKNWFGPKTVAQVSKLKFVTWKDLERSLPDHIPGKEIGALFAQYDSEDASNDKSDDGEGLDKVDPKAVKKKFDDRKDKDIDNDGDTDDSDEFLHKRRKAISKSIAKEVKEKAKDYVLAVNPKDPKAKRGGGVQKVKKRDWPALQKKGWILAEQAIIHIDPENKYIEVDFGPAEMSDILVEGIMYERWSIPKAPQTNPNSGDNLVAWKHDFVDWLGELEPGAKFHIGFADSDTVGDYPDTGKRNVARYKFITKVIGKKVAEVMKALEKVSTIK